MADDKKPTGPIPTGWFERGAKLAGATSKGAARFVGTRFKSFAAPERSEEFLGGFHEKTAQQLVEMLGEMKGAAMKLGQLASFYEFGEPTEYMSTYRDALTMLQNSAPPMDPAASRKVIEEEFGRPVEDIFETFTDEAVAAASIGQVHRATLPGGQPVAVKVQYPGVDEAVRSDIRNVSAMTKLAVAVAPNLDPKAVANEVKERVLEELDYRREATNQKKFAELYAGHPYIVVPEVYMDYCHTRVITQEFMEGAHFMDAFERPFPERNRIAEIVFRFFYGSLNRFMLFSADPHPGNYLLLKDGRVAFLDYGLVRAIDPGTHELLIETSLALIENDKERGREALEGMGILTRKTPEIDAVWDHMREMNRPILEDRRVKLSAELVAELGRAGFDPRSKAFNELRKVGIPAVMVTFNRMSFGVASILGRLEAENNWQAIGKEFWFGDASRTTIGKKDQAWFKKAHPEIPPPMKRAAR
jgi:predicted unusual protein kinase regulating ubiquinone biosynthesis (AarF/ABC1/UbiB family)